ncbi:MAG: EVE domain-containing protein [Gemmatimonadales bacterium]
MTKYWIGVVSLSHVERGVTGGFAQLGHGKAAPLQRMSKGDWLVYYSPKTDFADGEPLRQFTAIGQVIGDAVYKHRMSPDFVPSRRDVRFVKSKPTPIAPLIPGLSFIGDPKRWGFPFRRGHIEMTKADFQLIVTAMKASVDE